MKRCSTPGLLLVWVGLVLFAVQTPVMATSYHTIAIDGSNDFEADEDVPSTSSTIWHFTWDASNFYFGTTNDNINDYSTVKWALLYIDSDSHGSNGTTMGLRYNNQQPGLPFSADYHFRRRTDGGFMDLQRWDGSNWVEGTQTGIAAYRSGQFVEFRIPRSNIGSPEAVKVCGGMINEQPLSEYTYYMAPNNNLEGYNPNYSGYFGFLLISSISPDFSGYVDTYPAVTEATGNYSDAATWTGAVVPPDGANVFVANGHTLTLDSDRIVEYLTVAGTLWISSNTLIIGW
jgi:hypothetical protein